MAEESFKLNQASSEFTTRSKDVFANLDTLEKKHIAAEKVRDESPGARAELKRLWKAEPDIVPDDSTTIVQTSNFKRPYSRPPNRHGVSKYRRTDHSPDYKQNPEKWTKYSLEDVPSADMSDASNSRAALAFLEERRQLREAAEKGDNPDLDDEGLGGKMLFKKPSKTTTSFSKSNVFKKKASAGAIKVDHLGSDENVGDASDELETAQQEANDEKDKCETSTRNDNVVNDSTEKTEFIKFHFKKGIKKRNIRSKELVDEDDD